MNNTNEQQREQYRERYGKDRLRQNQQQQHIIPEVDDSLLDKAAAAIHRIQLQQKQFAKSPSSPTPPSPPQQWQLQNNQQDRIRMYKQYVKSNNSNNNIIIMMLIFL